jgi:hypothetical protein
MPWYLSHVSSLVLPVAVPLLLLLLLQVYIGSFNSEAPIDAGKNPHCVQLFEKEQAQLLHDLYEIPSRSCDRKVGR